MLRLLTKLLIWKPAISPSWFQLQAAKITCLFLSWCDLLREGRMLRVEAQVLLNWLLYKCTQIIAPDLNKLRNILIFIFVILSFAKFQTYRKVQRRVQWFFWRIILSILPPFLKLCIFFFSHEPSGCRQHDIMAFNL